jgi:hypothetical protein
MPPSRNLPTFGPVLTEQALQEIAEFANKATPGPWFPAPSDPSAHAVSLNAPNGDPRFNHTSWEELVTTYGNEDSDPTTSMNVARANAEFIGVARNAVPALLAEVGRLTHELDLVTEALGIEGGWSDDVDLIGLIKGSSRQSPE